MNPSLLLLFLVGASRLNVNVDTNRPPETFCVSAENLNLSLDAATVEIESEQLDEEEQLDDTLPYNYSSPKRIDHDYLAFITPFKAGM